MSAKKRKQNVKLGQKRRRWRLVKSELFQMPLPGFGKEPKQLKMRVYYGD